MTGPTTPDTSRQLTDEAMRYYPNEAEIQERASEMVESIRNMTPEETRGVPRDLRTKTPRSLRAGTENAIQTFIKSEERLLEIHKEIKDLQKEETSVTKEWDDAIRVLAGELQKGEGIRVLRILNDNLRVILLTRNSDRVSVSISPIE